MTLGTSFELAHDAEFRTLLTLSSPPRAGRVTALEASGQVRVELDDAYGADGGNCLAWPLDGMQYAAGDLVYVLFAANAPDAGIVVGSHSLAPVRFTTQQVAARNSAGLALTDDAGNLGLQVEDGGDVGIGTASPDDPLVVYRDLAAPARIQINNPNASGYATFVLREGASYRGWLEHDNANNWTVLNGHEGTLKLQTAGADRIVINSAGVGIGITPQARLHSYTGVSGMLHWSGSNGSGTATVIHPNTTGDVANYVLFLYVMNNAGTRAANVTGLANGASTAIVCGSGTWTFRVNADGSFDVRRTAGSGTATIAVLALWI